MREQTSLNSGFRPAEVAALAQQYGQPRLVEQELHLQHFVDAAAELPPRRVAEVVPVIRRPNGRIVTMIKTFYPRGAYRLPTGGLRANEDILAGLQREVYEETGLQPGIQRFLATIRYHILLAGGGASHFTSYVFSLEASGPLQTLDASENILEFREVTVADLRPMADFLDHLHGPGMLAYPWDDRRRTDEYAWPDWGKFRAVAHRVVADLLEHSA